MGDKTASIPHLKYSSKFQEIWDLCVRGRVPRYHIPSKINPAGLIPNIIYP
jgi:hypothetical protein